LQSTVVKTMTTGVLAALLMSGAPGAGGVPSAIAQERGEALRIRTTRFWAGEGRTRVEAVVGVPIRGIDGQPSTAQVDLVVRDANGQELTRESWTDTISERLAAVARARGGTEITTPISFAVREGNYTITAVAVRGNQRDSAQTTVQGFASAPLVSDLVVSSRIRALPEGEQANAAELKRGRFAIERGTRITIFPTEPRLPYYLELYPAGSAAVNEQLEFAIHRATGGDPLFRTQRPITVTERGGVDVAAVPLAGLPPGEYVLSVTAKVGDRSERREAAFTMGTLQDAPAVSAPPATSGARSESDLLDRYFSATTRTDPVIKGLVEALILAAPGEAVPSSTLQLPADAQRRFLARYWSRIPDPTPATAPHDMLEEYINRVAVVSREYVEKDIGRSGARTDRGRIYLKYGPPDIKQILQLAGSRAIEAWKYTKQRGLKFAFLDETGFSNFNLVFTTDPQEQTLADWQDRVRDIEAIRFIVSF
jgi:GWxTD domain-containing protein